MFYDHVKRHFHVYILDTVITASSLTLNSIKIISTKTSNIGLEVIIWMQWGIKATIPSVLFGFSPLNALLMFYWYYRSKSFFSITEFSEFLEPRHRRCRSPIVITLSVCPSVHPSTLCCNAITRTVFYLQTSYFIHRWRIKKGRHL